MKNWVGGFPSNHVPTQEIDDEEDSAIPRYLD